MIFRLAVFGRFQRTSDCNEDTQLRVIKCDGWCSADFSARAIATLSASTYIRILEGCSADFSARAIATRCMEPLTARLTWRCSADFSARAIATLKDWALICHPLKEVFGRFQRTSDCNVIQRVTCKLIDQGVRPISAHERLQPAMDARSERSYYPVFGRFQRTRRIML